MLRILVLTLLIGLGHVAEGVKAQGDGAGHGLPCTTHDDGTV
ncbi:MAG: hypothetical protein R3D85_06260 [Paracoccaceae bacterium]